MKLKHLLLLSLSALVLASCDKDDDNNEPETGNNPSYNVPETYTFTDADGNNTVSYSGQEERLNQLGEMTALMKTGNTPGTRVDARSLKDMFANVNGDGNENFSFTSTKQLKNKCANQFTDAAAIQADFESWMDKLELISSQTQAGVFDASNGQAGCLNTDGAGPYLVDENGFEPVQIIEKGLMGAVFYHQITGYYLTDEKIGDAVDNSTPVDPDNGKHYTAMEHHWDEAFGYFTTATNFPQEGTDRFWGKYSNTVDPHLGSNQKIMDAYLKGRAAISNGDMATKEEMRDIVIEELELVVAGTAIHYLNGGRENFTNDAIRVHQLSEAYAFLNDLRYNPRSTATPQQINALLADLGDNFYDITITDINRVRDELSAIYQLDAVKEVL